MGAFSQQRAGLALAGDSVVAAVTMLQCASDLRGANPFPDLLGAGQTPARQTCPVAQQKYDQAHADAVALVGARFVTW
jgi:hypothetical protein